MFELSRDSSVPLVEQICERITALLRAERLGPGTRLPSIRGLARQIGASPFTVVDAYERLVARGLIESRAGRGFFVAAQRPALPLTAIEAVPDPGTDALALARLTLSQCADLIPAGSGFLPESWLLEALPASELLRTVKKHHIQPWMPCPPQGLPQLREHIAARLLQQGIAVSPAHLLTTSGASHAFDLLARILFAPGDAVLVEDPGYFVLFAQLRAHHVRLIPVPRGPLGPDLAALEEACRTHRPRAFFLQTLLHNPTGSSADAAHCHRILSLAEQFGFAIVEDDVYGDLHEGPAVRLAQIDGLRHVIHVGSFSKLVGPALRVGFIAADQALITQLVERKVLSVLSGSALLESLVAQVLDGGRYKRHVERLRARLQRMRGEARSALAAVGIEFEAAARDGMFLWGRAPQLAAVDALVRRAREHSILLARGTLFSPADGCAQWLRFNVCHSTRPPLLEFLRRELEAA